MVRRSDERRPVRHGGQETWLTLFPQRPTDPLAGDGPFELLSEDRLAPGTRLTSSSALDHDAEVLTYVCEGTLAYDDPNGRARTIHAGEFRRSSTRNKIRHCRNGSRKHAVHFFQIRLRAAAARSESGVEQKRFCAAERRGLLCVVASPDGRNGSLCFQHDALIHSAIVSPGQHLVHELAQGQSAWIQVVRGEVALGQLVLARGDGAGISAARALSLTARQETELLLLEPCD